VRYNPVAELVKKAAAGRKVALPAINLTLSVSRGDVVIDCGANVGDVTSRFFRTGATVYAFEPNPICFKVLRRRFFGLRNVKCINQGVMDRNTTLRLETPLAHRHFDALDATVAATFLEGIHTAAEYRSNSVEVECIDLSAFIYRVGRVKFLKVDIEGAEIPVINSLIDTGAIENVELAAVETHERFSPELLAETNALRDRISRERLAQKIRLDWY
jgi:FkbM family methyltransferase